jgi:hypothetical protein
LPEDDVLAGKEKLDALIAEGNKSFNEGRTDEAMAVAETALASNPTSTNALSLKVLCHERRGELAEALECADQIVDLNPDSELDKIKRNQLRTKLALTVQLATQEPDRRIAIIGAVAAVILFVCIGIGAAKLVTRRDQPTVVSTPNQQEPQVQQQTPQQPAVSQTASQNLPRNPVVPQSNPTTRVADDSDNPGLSALEVGDTLPKARGNGGAIEVSSDPPSVGSGPIGQPGNSGTVVKPTRTNISSTQPSEQVTDPNPTPVTQNTSQTNEDPGKIEISVSNAQPRTNAGGSETVNSGGASALVHVGMQRFQLGQFSSAASSFEQAIRAGGDQMSLNQRLGQCYDNLGRKNDAIEAYKRGIAACQAALNSGNGNKDGIQKRLDSCQQALKVLQGN